MSNTSSDRRDESTSQAVASRKRELESLASIPGHPDVPDALYAFARAHLAAGLPAASRRDAIGHLWAASDALVALIGLPTGSSSIFLFDEKKELTFGKYEASAWSTTRVWLDAFYATIWSARTENLDSWLVPTLGKMRRDEEPDALRTYARGLLALLDGAPEQDGDVFTYFRRARKQLGAAGSDWGWLSSRLDGWDALENGDSREFVRRLEVFAAVEDPNAIDAGTSVSLEASALYALARRARFTVFDLPREPRLRLVPQT